MKNYILRLARFAVNIAKTGFFIGTVLLIALAALIWFFGPSFFYLDYAPFAPVNNRLIAIAVLVFLWGINNYFLARAQRRKRPKDSAKIEWTPPDPIEERLVALRQMFRNCMRVIQDKWTGREGKGRSLYALPWYLVLGASNSGKSALIRDADLSFPLEHSLNDVTKAASSADLPQYWVTNESILFDLPGSWMVSDNADEAAGANTANGRAAQAKENRLWDMFLSLLVEYRPRRPINGVILAIDIVDLIRSSDAQRLAKAASIHARLVEVGEKLGTRFTVHVVLTKLDRLAGFRDYFAAFSRSERSSAFGFSFPIYDELAADQWVEDFEREFQLFMQQVNDDLLDRLYGQRDTTSRRNIYVFSRHLAAAGTVVADFVKHALASDRFSTPPLVRGVFFTSARQEGVPFNAVLHRVSQDYFMQPPILAAHAGHSTRHFTETLFKNVIFRESGLAGDNHQVERHKRLVLRGSILASVIVLLGFGFLLNMAMQDNFSRAANVLSASKDFIDLPRGDQLSLSEDETRYIAALNAISSANEEFPGWRDRSDARRYMALYQGRRLGPEVEQSYHDLLQKRFLPSLAEQIRQELLRLGKDYRTSNSDERLDALRVYLLLGNVARRRELDARDETASLGRRAVIAWMQRSWQSRFAGDRGLQDDLVRHLDYALATGLLAPVIDDGIVQHTQSALREVPRDVRLYRSLKALAERQVPGGISLRNIIGPSYDIVFRQRGDADTNGPGPVIPYFYTKEGFLNFFIPKNADLSVVAVEDAWVTGERQQVDYSHEDLEAFREKLRQAYATDYINAWSNAINNLNLVEFRNIDDAIRVFAEINGPANPYRRLIALVRLNTEIYDAKPVEVRAERSQTEIGFDRNREHGLRVARAFADLSALIIAPEGKNAAYEELTAPLIAMETYLRGIQNGQQSSKPVALERAKERAKLAGDDPIFVLRRTGSNLPKPLDRLFAQAADHSWQVILRAAKHDLQLVWQNDIYRRFNMELAGLYPFKINSPDEISLEEFQRFFGSDGEFNRFFNENLKTFIDEHSGKAILIDGQELQVSREFLQQVAVVRGVTNLFFNNDGVPTLRYQIEPVAMSGSIARAVLNLEGQLVAYSHGPTRPTSILWPNALSSKQDISQISLSGVEQRGSSGVLSHQGLWSSFRLFDQARIGNVSSDSVHLSFDTAKGRITYRLRMASTEKNPFVLRPLSQLRLPEQL